MHDERAELIRIARQRLEWLSRSGIDRIPTPKWSAPRPARPAAPSTPVAAQPSPTIATTPPAPPRPQPIAATPPPPPPPSRVPALAASLFDDTPLGSEAVVPIDQRLPILNELAGQVAACTKCPQLAQTRTQTVFSSGTASPRLMFIGEAPGADEDRTGIPFVGKAGQLLNDMITKGMGLSRDDVYVANVLKCRPPENRTPEPDEMANCFGYLERQIEVVHPEFLCLLGKTAATAMLNTALPMSRLRSKWHRYRGIPTIATYHPSYLLRQPAAKKEAWEDLQMLMLAMGLKVPKK